MSTTVKNIPALRFPEFQGEWLKDNLDIVADINKSNLELPDTFVYIDLESVDKGVLLKEQTVRKNDAPSRAQRVLSQNEILFQMVRPYQMNNYFFIKKGDYVASTGYAQIKAKIYPQYLYHYLHNERFVKEVILRCTGTSYPAINSSDLATVPVIYPKDKPEQQKIADFLTAVDERIQKLSRKKELLEQYKKGVMQQIFSQQKRFKDDNGNNYPDWEEKRLGNICHTIMSGKTKPNNEGEVPVYGSMGVIGYSNIATHKGLYILVARVGANAGTLNIVEGEFSVTDNTLILDVKNEISTSFLYFYLNQHDLSKYVFGSGQPLITGKQLKQILLLLPVNVEQQKIADYLSSIDDKIAKVNTELEHSQTFKKGLLQQMFV